MKAILLVFGLLLVSAAAFGAPPKVAVLDTILPANMERSVSVGVTEKISEEFVNSGRYTVLDRTTVGQSLKEIEFQLSGLVNDAEIRKAGEQLNSRLGASYVVVVQVSKIGGTYFISAKLIDINTGEIVAQASHDAEGDIAVNIRIAQVVGQRLASGIRESPRAVLASPSRTSPEGAPAGSRSAQSWGSLAGTWLVDVGKRPAGWNDDTYVFASDGTLEVYHSIDGAVTLHYRGALASIGDMSFLTETGFQAQPSGKPELLTDYAFLSSTRLRIGWGGVTYLELTRQ